MKLSFNPTNWRSAKKQIQQPVPILTPSPQEPVLTAQASRISVKDSPTPNKSAAKKEAKLNRYFYLMKVGFLDLLNKEREIDKIEAEIATIKAVTSRNRSKTSILSTDSIETQGIKKNIRKTRLLTLQKNEELQQELTELSLANQKIALEERGKDIKNDHDLRREMLEARQNALS